MDRIVADVGFILLSLAGYVGVFLLLAAAAHGLAYFADWRRGKRELKRFTSDANQIRARMGRLREMTLLLVPAQTPGFSKLGGAPELPPSLNWPEGVRSPRAFLAQIDLAAFRAHGHLPWLPGSGRLYFFYDPEREGFADCVSVLSSEENPGAAADLPARLERRWRFMERRVSFMPTPSIPSLDWLGVDLASVDLSDEELDELAEAHDAAFGDEIQHRLGGYPSEIQGSQMQIECEHLRRGIGDFGSVEIPPAIRRAARQWRLLLQVDSDPALGMNWGDGGRLYVFIRKADALKGDFSKTVALAQTP